MFPLRYIDVDTYKQMGGNTAAAKKHNIKFDKQTYETNNSEKHKTNLNSFLFTDLALWILCF